MALATRTARTSALGTLWGSTVGKKAVMAATGVIMLLWLTAHMLGNLKIFFGPAEFNGYAAWLRTLGEPALHEAWFLWIQRAVLALCVVLHGVAAYQLSRRDLAARPQRYAHRRPRASYATRTMRWGGVILGLFVVWHLLDLTAGVVNPLGEDGHPYQNVVADFRTWYADVFYIAAMLALGLHVRHGFWSAAQTLGANNRRRDRALKATANVLAVLLTAGFVSVPVAVMTGLVD
ncbi:succinate dehydrogenase cytochrome b subunit [Streptacidiphilus sp. ASG 303]|uniref:succinate dehydrogenase cytochrome b subunit n=1 Tax=Streptomycetaceae TaxID=2062 RepID=UPI001E46E5C1|nr:succinate dehydrogenase cytochrome b subunit [Streptacidiphilus sp. ASG 303]MCD0485472.1 succinate dehydrogenase cytochrome b subunit [Streptacidiphilus sp. ASG 303]